MNGLGILMNNERVNITTYPRIHLTLISMNKNGYRVNGGFGFSIQNPFTNFSITPSKKFEIRDHRKYGIKNDDRTRIEVTVSEIIKTHNFKKNVIVDIDGEVIPHHGFGSGTSTRLAILEALYILNNQKYEKFDLINFSGRGGTSGIGINTYFDGLGCLDLGHKNDINQVLAPSSVKENIRSIPLVMQQVKLPDWEIGICLPYICQSKGSKEEKKFFDSVCPIQDASIYKTLYHVIYGLYASVLEEDKATFASSIKAIQNCTWKKAEISRHGERLKEVISFLYKAGADSVGMSSMGPCLYFLGNDLVDIIEKLNRKIDCYQCYITRPMNQGRTIQYA